MDSAPQTPHAPGATSATRSDQGLPGVVRTFIVEDSTVIRDNLVATLEELAPVRVYGSAATELDALQKLSAPGAEFELVILDIVLAQGSGLGVLADPGVRRPGRRFVVLSNYATQDVARRASHLGADRVFDKSNDIDRLIDYCQQLVAE